MPNILIHQEHSWSVLLTTLVKASFQLRFLQLLLQLFFFFLLFEIYILLELLAEYLLVHSFLL